MKKRQMGGNIFSFRVVLVGDSGVGKSSFMSRYLHNQFITSMKSTAGIDYGFTKKVIEGKTVKLQIWDTSGQQKYYSTCSTQIKSASVAILFFDLTREPTFNIMRTLWLAFVEQKIPEDGFFIIYGNKEDLFDVEPEKDKKIKQFQLQLQEIKEQYPNRIKNVFYGSCKDENNPGIKKMMNFIFQHCYDQKMSQTRNVMSQQIPTNPSVVENPRRTYQTDSIILSNNDEEFQVQRLNQNQRRKKWCW